MKPRREIVNEEVTSFYHITSRCIRRLFLINDERKQWLENHLRFLGRLFSIDVIGYVFLDNHFHLIIRLDTPRMKSWDDVEAVRRWATVFTPRGLNGAPVDADCVDAWIAQHAADPVFVAKARATLSNLGCFMKCLKQPIARMANIEDNHKGAFFDGRYKSIGILDEEALVATSIYVDLNPIAAGVAKKLEDVRYSGLHARVEHAKAQGVGDQLAAASVPMTDYETGVIIRQASLATHEAEKSLWMLPIYDERITNSKARPGMSDRFHLPGYDMLVRAVLVKRQRMADAISAEVRARMERIGLDVDKVADAVDRIVSNAANDRWGYMRGSAEKLRDAAKQMGRQGFGTHNHKATPNDIKV